MHRRTILRRTTLPAALALAGCTAPSGEPDGEADAGGGSDGSEGVSGTPPIPMLEDPPEAVYLPGHRKSMRVLEPVDAGEYALTPMLSYPHPFWIVTANYREFVEPAAGRGVHLMVVVWDRETGRVLPGAEPRATVSRDGREIDSRALWPMLSQEMGLHVGDNVDLPADGTYAVDVEFPPLSIRRTGSLAGRFAEGATATFEFTYDRAFREAVVEGIELLDRERWGQRGALEPMVDRAGTDDGSRDGSDDDGSDADDGRDAAGDGDGGTEPMIPYSRVPPADAYPGTRLVESVGGETDATAGDGLPTSGDAAFVVALLEPESRLADGDDPYLLVSPRTPYNRVPLSNASLRVVLERDARQVLDERLEPVIDGEYGHHYGRSVSDVRESDTVRIAVESPPQTARHQGYETAFFGMDPVELVVPSA
ncbi:hypothetical protein NP511_02425 [Natrinema thermotolerans]|uniref:DUF7350 domain-containing protein n=1 Tax=Natrinema thermotolerans TaxID=121872 RepID=A0AAF0PBI5_9EURY|nr:hypothetical protein [Natrinema thermotolerans]QCC57424.1 hypothetical protein DVR14_01715 [Natrinema thermotolerans]WMT08497.1 hypothetical protein NP511_02425 [Natrinema thermotolerans]